MSKKIQKARQSVDKYKDYSVDDAIRLIRENAFTKFDPTLEISMNLGVDTKKSTQVVRGMVSLPAGTGRNVRVAVICKDDKVALAKAAGADIAGSTDLIESIKAGNVDFDVCIATPDMMAVVGQVARVLGPKGLMPNPKLGTVTADITTAVGNAKSGQVEFRAEKGGIVHAGLGKLSFSPEALMDNVKAFVSAVVKAKPAESKGVYLKKIHLSSTMGPSVKIDLSGVGINLV
jgi:large subunit ribosomal protein L1